MFPRVLDEAEPDDEEDPALEDGQYGAHDAEQEEQHPDPVPDPVNDHALQTAPPFPSFPEPALDVWSEAPGTFGLLIYLAGVALSIAFVVQLLSLRRAPTATLTWIVFILAWPYLGIALYYLFPHRLHLRRLRRRVRRLARRRTGPGRVPSDAGGDHALARFLQRVEPQSAAGGNHLRLFETGQGFFLALAESIRAAKSFVHLQFYIFRPDETGLRLLALLEETARRGVEVRLLYDHLGSWSLKEHHVAALRRAGGRVSSFAPLLWRHRPFNVNLRNHRKLAVLDGRLAFLGGRNVAAEYELDLYKSSGRWLDAMVSIEGPAVLPLHAVFAEDWFNATDEELIETRHHPQVPAAGTSWVGALASGPDRERNLLRYVLFEMLSQAKETIDISTPYLVPHPSILTVLEVAALRGVRIRVHTNAREVAEGFILYHAARSYYPLLLDLGIELIETRADFNHTKVFIVDRRQMYFGSANLDMRSFELNFEVGALVVDPEFCAEATALFERRAAEGRRVERKEIRLTKTSALLDGACRLLSPVL